jgi:hypothetical protein
MFKKKTKDWEEYIEQKELHEWISNFKRWYK